MGQTLCRHSQIVVVNMMIIAKGSCCVVRQTKRSISLPVLRPSFMGIGFGSGILLDLVLFADRIIAEPKSNRSILWDMEVCNDLNGVCAFF